MSTVLWPAGYLLTLFATSEAARALVAWRPLPRATANRIASLPETEAPASCEGAEEVGPAAAASAAPAAWPPTHNNRTLSVLELGSGVGAAALAAALGLGHITAGNLHGGGDGGAGDDGSDLDGDGGSDSDGHASDSSGDTGDDRVAVGGITVMATDSAPAALALTTANAALNGLSGVVRARRLDWQSDADVQAAVDANGGPFDLVLGASLQFERWGEGGRRLWRVLDALTHARSVVALAHTAGALPQPPEDGTSRLVERRRYGGVEFGFGTRWSADVSDFEVVVLAGRES